MNTHLSPPVFSLRVKLVLSYLGVALGAILLLVIVVSVAVQNYFYNSQRDQLRANAEVIAQQIGQRYHNSGESWDSLGPFRIFEAGPYVVVDTNLQVRSTAFLDVNGNPTARQALQQALQGQEVPGDLPIATNDGRTITALYISVPLRDGGQANGSLIGALLLLEPVQYPAGFSPYEFLANVDKTIFITGIAIAVAVIIFSLLLTRSLTRPLTSLTRASELMKGGNYAERAYVPQSQDEIGKLASTFNAMADKIESDVTELRRQDMMRRELIANIAHDLVTPLTAIQGFSEALADDVISEPQARQETAQLIGREVQRLRRLVSDMQHMSVLEAGRVELEVAPLDLHTLVDEVLAVIRPECEQAGITLYNEVAPSTPPVLADSDRITQALLNLLDNARRNTPAGGSITIGARAEIESHQQGAPLQNQPLAATGTRRLKVWVRDTGVGIDASDLPYIFDRFFRVDRARTGTNGGSGLGLSIVKAIITAHRGTIHAQSSPGKGTCIEFTLPLARQQALAEASS